jgi:signal transduction histidine kinase
VNSDHSNVAISRRSRIIDFVTSSLRERTVLVLLVLFGGAAAVILWQHSRIQSSQIQASAIRDAARYTDVIREFRTLYSSEVVSKAQLSGIEVSHDYEGKPGIIPLPATLSMELGNRIASTGSGGETRLYSPYPFPWRTKSGGLQSGFAKDAWESLNRNPDQPYWRIEDIDGRASLRYATADLMCENCVKCHNSHADTPRNDWQLGDVRGVLEVITPLHQAVAESEASRRSFALLLFVPGLIAVALIITRLRVASDTQAASNHELQSENVQRLQAEADLQRLTKSLKQRADELQRSRMAALNMMRDAERSESLQRAHAEDLSRANSQLETEIAERQQAEKDREHIQQRLVETSRQAGMAEVATGVLHNVGNVLNSVNVSANVLQETLRGSRVEMLAKASQELFRHQDGLADFVTTDIRGRHFPDLLNQLTASLQGERDKQMKELHSLVENIEHIKHIVSMQQSLACVSGATELLNVVDLLNDARKINDAGLNRHGINVVCEFDDLPPVHTERHKVLQILINLIGNAKGATSVMDQPSRTITLSASGDDDGIRVQVRDNGIGIPAENLSRIFTHGFTTKKDGHGFGLHSSALAAQELGGSLSVHSDGPGTGATFTLRLPLEQLASRSAAETACTA